VQAGTIRSERVAGDGEVILCAGAVNSPQLLMLSGVGPADALGAHGIAPVHEMPGVGRGLMDHLTAGVIQHATKPVSLLAGRGLVPFLRWIVAGRGPLTSNVAEAVAFVRTRPDLEAPDLELLFAPVMFVEEGLREPPGHGMTVGAVALSPASRGTIELSSSDPEAAPRIDPGFLSDGDGSDLRVLKEGVRMARSILATSAFDAFRGDEYIPGAVAVADADVADAIRLRAQTLYHPACTCRMGNDDEAVCDASLRVRGLDGLRVVDASAMPVLVRAHPNAAVTMMAERAAAMMRGEPGAALDA